MKLPQARFLLFFVLFSIVQASHSQSKVDSLQQIWQNENEVDSIRFNAIKHYYTLRSFRQPDSVIIVSEYHFNLAQRKNAKRQMVWAKNKEATMNRLLDSFPKAERLFGEALDLAREVNDPVMVATLQGNLGINYMKRGNYKDATQLYATALKTFQERKDTKGEGHMLNNLAGVYYLIGNYELASDYYRKSLDIFKKRGIEDKKTAILLMNLGSIQQELNDPEGAKDYFLKALDILATENDAFLLSGCYNSLVEIFLKTGELETAQGYAEKSSSITQELGIKTGIAHSKIVMAKVAFKSDVGKATQLLEEVTSDLPKGLSNKTKKEIFELLYKGYKEQNKPKISLEMHERFVAYNDSLQREQSDFAVIRETVKNEFEIKLFENKLKNEKEQATLKLKQLKTNFGIITGAVLLIGSLLLYFRSYNRKNLKRRQLLLAELEKLKRESQSKLVVDSGKLELDRAKIETAINRELNETDWKVLNILLEHNLIPNKEIAEKAFMSVDGIGSSLRRMYEYFNIKDSKYKKISLLTEAIKLSNK